MHISATFDLMLQVLDKIMALIIALAVMLTTAINYF